MRFVCTPPPQYKYVKFDFLLDIALYLLLVTYLALVSLTNKSKTLLNAKSFCICLFIDHLLTDCWIIVNSC